MKKMLAAILSLLMLSSLCACGKEKAEIEYSSEPDKTQAFTQQKYIQERIIPPVDYERVTYLSASDYGFYTESCLMNQAGELIFTSQLLDTQYRLIKNTEGMTLESAEQKDNCYSYVIGTRVLNDGKLALVTSLVPRDEGINPEDINLADDPLADDGLDWDKLYQEVDIIDWLTGTERHIELDSALKDVINDIMYDGENLGFYSRDALGVYTPEGELVGLYETSNWIDSACFMNDGSVAVLEYKQGLETGDMSKDMGQIIRFDPATGSAEDFLTPSVHITQLLDAPYDEEYFSFYIDDGSGIKGLDPDGQLREILNWVGTGLTGRAMALEALSGRRFAYLDMNGAVILKPSSVDMSEISVLRMGTLNPYPISGLVAEFNQISEKYRIELVDYSTMTSDDGKVSGEELMDMDIVSGAGPDILDLCSLPMKKYQQAGLLEELTQYIQADESLRNVELLQAPLKALETEDGRLYTLVPAYGISTLVGDPAYNGVERLNVTAMGELFDKMDEGQNPFGIAMSKNSFLDALLNMNCSQFADWDSLQCDFNTPDFAALLEMAAKLPDTEDVSEQLNMLRSGEQLVSLWNFLSIDDIMAFNSFLNNNMAIYGLPTVPEQGTAMMPLVALGISVNCRDKEGAWSFLSALLSDNYQKSLAGQALPATQAGLDYILDDYMAWADSGGQLIATDDTRDEVAINADARYADMLTDAIDSIGAVYNNDSQLINIILRDAQACFVGDISAQKAAEQIQSRAKIYMAEQFG